jgi:prophage antirepressor-like protein
MKEIIVMKNQIQQFHSREFGSLDIMLIDGKPYFPATECAKVLGYTNPKAAIIRHCRGVLKRDLPSTSGIQSYNFIPEGDLYRLIIRSKLPSAERFERWVFDEVLPTIRKYGAFIMPETLEEMLRSPAFTEQLLRALGKEREKSAALEGLTKKLAPKAAYFDLILQSKNAVPVSLIAKDYGMSATAFNRLLHHGGIQYRVGGTWVLYQGIADMGYTQTRTYNVGERTSAIYTCWTQKGRLFLYEALKRCGILPLVEKHAI